jgi:hypothetical protein
MLRKKEIRKRLIEYKHVGSMHMEKVSSGASVKSRPLGSKATTTCKPNIAFLFLP